MEETLDEPILQKLLEYWRSIRPDQGLPSRGDIDPAAIPALLPHIMLVDVSEGNGRIFMRLVGTRVAFGTDPTGTYMNDTVPPGAYGTHILSLFNQAADTARPLYTEYQYGARHSPENRIAKRLFLPLAETGAATEMMLVGQIVVSRGYLEKSLWETEPADIRELRLVVMEA